MAYQALYRAFRPASLGELVRQEHIVRILRNQIQSGRIGHAYLFCGPRGTGKTSTAKIFAKAINCENPLDGSPCGCCATCRALADPSNLDITEIDAASNNGVNEMRDLREKVQYPPVACRYKVYIIDEVHMLSESAFNALLKTLEEPPAHAVFILATTEPHKLPATILSRCMRFDFKLIPQRDIEEHLKNVFRTIGKEYEDEAVAAIARAGAGSMRDSLSVADMCVSYSEGKLTYADVNEVLGSADFYEIAALGGAVLAGNAPDALERTEKILSGGKSAGVLAKDLLVFFNRCTIARTCRGAESLFSLPGEMFAELKGIADSAETGAILRACEIFAGTEADLRYSVTPRIVLETAVVKAAMPEADGDVSALARRIGKLERMLAEGASVPAAPPAVPASAPEARTEAERPVLSPEPEPAPFGEEAAPARRKDAPPAAGPDRKKTYALFLRELRRTGDGVLFTMCQDMESFFEGDTFVLVTDSGAVRDLLSRAEKRAAVAAALQRVGITEFEIRQKDEEEDPVEEGIRQLKKNFPNTEIRIK